MARTQNGRLMPLDSGTRPNGNLILQEEDNDARGPLALYVGKPDPGALLDEYEGRRYVTHFATCPQAAAHRVKR